MTAALNVLSLFAGIGGLELGLERAGMTVVGQVEIDGYCRRVLAKHWPDVPRHDDVRTAVDWWTSEPRPRVDVVCGGFPCQPVSEAGQRLAQEDARWLWPAMATVVAAIRPAWVVGENVPGLLTAGIDDVVADLRRLGYRVRVGLISACAVGAPHARERVFVLAHTERIGCDEGRDQPTTGRAGEAGSTFTQGWFGATAGSDWGTPEPDVARMAYGVPNRMDRTRALGNAVVPAAAEYIGHLIVDAHGRDVSAPVVPYQFAECGADAGRAFVPVATPTCIDLVVGKSNGDGESGHASDDPSRPTEVNSRREPTSERGVA